MPRAPVHGIELYYVLEGEGTVTLDGIRHAVFANHLLEEHPCKLWGIDIFPTRQIDRHLGRYIHQQPSSGIRRVRRFDGEAIDDVQVWVPWHNGRLRIR